MREIKFRAWDKIHQIMLQPERIQDLTVTLKKPDHFIPLQYTGLKDRNSTEIYESDIVYDLNHEARGIIVWQNSSCDYELEDRDGNFIQAFGFEKSLYEVIGNIYENPELLQSA